MKRVSDEIGEEYKTWNSFDRIFITAPTGTGKTFFVLHYLLEFAYQNNRKVLYLVNRRILKEQIAADVLKLPYPLHSCIQIELYQTIENRIRKISDKGLNVSGYEALKEYSNYDYVICDECHYFLSDSNFNTNTCLSFYWVQSTFCEKIRVFLSATMDEFLHFMKQEDKKNCYFYTQTYGFCSGIINHDMEIVKNRRKLYHVEKQYNYLDIQVICSEDEIINEILSSKDKWLIFVDSKKIGNDLKEKISGKLKKENVDAKVVMLSSNYYEEEDAREEVNGIVYTSKQTAKVLISTSVMDNGISLKDLSLRNIVIMADTEVEFIQMLGRKREDDKRTKLYVYKYTKGHFELRLSQLQQTRKMVRDYFDVFVKQIKEPLENESQNGVVQDLDKYNQRENYYAYKLHKKLLNDLMCNQINFACLKRAFFAYDGRLNLNLLAFQHLENLNQYYINVIEAFKKGDDNTFVRIQLRWLGISETEIASAIMTKEEKAKAHVTERFNEVLNIELSKEAVITLKLTMVDDIRTLLNAVGVVDEEGERAINRLKEDVGKNDRGFSSKEIDVLQRYCGIQYRLTGRGDSFLLEKISE